MPSNQLSSPVVLGVLHSCHTCHSRSTFLGVLTANKNKTKTLRIT